MNIDLVCPQILHFHCCRSEKLCKISCYVLMRSPMKVLQHSKNKIVIPKLVCQKIELEMVSCVHSPKKIIQTFYFQHKMTRKWLFDIGKSTFYRIVDIPMNLKIKVFWFISFLRGWNICHKLRSRVSTQSWLHWFSINQCSIYQVSGIFIEIWISYDEHN